MRKLGQDSCCPDRDSYQSYPEYKSGMFPLHQPTFIPYSFIYTRVRAFTDTYIFLNLFLVSTIFIYLFLICYAHEVILCLWCISRAKIHPPPDDEESGHYQVRAVEL